MVDRRDYYEVLGVARDADAGAIKDAFHQLALRTHPDRNQAPDAEERFKEIAEAYAVLGNPKKRAEYDAGGFAGVTGTSPEDLFTGVDFENLFGDFGLEFGGLGGGGLFDRLFGRRGRGPPRGADVEVRVEVPLETVASGGEERVTVAHPRGCQRCSGSGAKPGTEPRRCDACDGTGRSSSVREQGQVRLQTVTTCTACGGRGRFIDEACDHCDGAGEVAESETLAVRIPVGVREGMLLRVPGRGRAAPEGGGAPGDLFVAVDTRPDPRFERRGAHLWRREEIEPADAVLGATLRVPTLDGHARLKVPAGTQPGAVLRMPGKGLPAFGGSARGDLYIGLQVRIPGDLSKEEKKLWERLRRLERERET
jgi:molecular chaperone DnaJ